MESRAGIHCGEFRDNRPICSACKRALVSAANSGAAWELRCHLREEIVKFLTERYPAALPRARIELAHLGDGAPVRASEAARPLQRTA